MRANLARMWAKVGRPSTTGTRKLLQKCSREYLSNTFRVISQFPSGGQSRGELSGQYVSSTFLRHPRHVKGAFVQHFLYLLRSRESVRLPTKYLRRPIPPSRKVAAGESGELRSCPKVWPNSDQRRPKLADLRRSLSWPKFGRMWPTSANVGHNRPNIGRIRQRWSRLATC